MRKRVNVLIVVLMVAVCVGLILPAISKMRETGNRMQCANNLNQVGIGLHSYTHDWNSFPAGTFYSAAVSAEERSWPPEKRNSWLVALKPYME